LPVATIPCCETEYMSAASDETATASSTIATIISTSAKPSRLGPEDFVAMLRRDLPETILIID
jgi:hypothetical protein